MKTIYSILLLMISTMALAQVKELQNIPQLQTKATFTQEVYADKITLSIRLSEADTNGKVSVEDLEKRLKNVLSNNGIDLKKQLTLTNMASNFKDYFLKKNDVQKIKNYEFVIHDALTAGKIFRGLENEEISNVRLLKTEYSKLKELIIILKGKAVEKAKRQAEEMLKSLDQDLGPAIFISDMQTKMYPVMSSLNTLNATAYQESPIKRSESLDVQFDKIQVEASVTVYLS